MSELGPVIMAASTNPEPRMDSEGRILCLCPQCGKQHAAPFFRTRGSGAGVEYLDEDVMRRAGWVRADQPTHKRGADGNWHPVSVPPPRMLFVFDEAADEFPLALEAGGPVPAPSCAGAVLADVHVTSSRLIPVRRPDGSTLVVAVAPGQSDLRKLYPLWLELRDAGAADTLTIGPDADEPLHVTPPPAP